MSASRTPGRVIDAQGPIGAVVQIVIRPAVAHRDDDGTSAVTGPLPDLTGFAALRQVADARDFEAVLRREMGVAARTGSRSLGLTGHSRVAVDVVLVEPGTGSQLLRRGDSGAAVATWQWRLVQALGRTLAVDEAFGPATEQATRDFRSAQGLSGDGIVGPDTRAAMVRALGL